MKKNKKVKDEVKDEIPHEEVSQANESVDETIKISDLMQENLRKASSDATEFKDKYLRALAEMENLRKRMSQEKQDMIAYAIDNMLSEFLTPLDSLENALGFTDNLSEELQNWAVGFKMISGQFNAVLESHNIIPFETIGRQFDPHFHEAVEMVETSSEEDGTVIQEIQKGYKHGERILRVAKVKVAQTCVKTEPSSPPCDVKAKEEELQ